MPEMNRHQEALEYLYAQATYYTNNDEADVVKQTIQELIDKATPKKVLNITIRKYRPFYDRHDEVVGKCPNEKCISYVFKEKDRSYCPDCGQALDWCEDDCGEDLLK